MNKNIAMINGRKPPAMDQSRVKRLDKAAQGKYMRGAREGEAEDAAEGIIKGDGYFVVNH